MKVWIDGAIVDGPDAKIPVTDPGLLYGDGVFEGIRVYGGAVFRLADHLRRLAAIGVNAILVGEALVTAQDVAEKVREFTGQAVSAGGHD